MLSNVYLKRGICSLQDPPDFEALLMEDSGKIQNACVAKYETGTAILGLDFRLGKIWELYIPEAFGVPRLSIPPEFSESCRKEFIDSLNNSSAFYFWSFGNNLLLHTTVMCSLSDGKLFISYHGFKAQGIEGSAAYYVLENCLEVGKCFSTSEGDLDFIFVITPSKSKDYYLLRQLVCARSIDLVGALNPCFKFLYNDKAIRNTRNCVVFQDVEKFRLTHPLLYRGKDGEMRCRETLGSSYSFESYVEDEEAFCAGMAVGDTRPRDKILFCRMESVPTIHYSQDPDGIEYSYLRD